MPTLAHESAAQQPQNGLTCVIFQCLDVIGEIFPGSNNIMGIRVRLLMALVALIGTASVGLGCNEDEFHCDWSCILKLLICDGRRDCRDGSDESPGWLFIKFSDLTFAQKPKRGLV